MLRDSKSTVRWAVLGVVFVVTVVPPCVQQRAAAAKLNGDLFTQSKRTKMFDAGNNGSKGAMEGRRASAEYGEP